MTMVQPSTARGIPPGVRGRALSRDKRRCRYCGRQCVSQKRFRGRDDSLTFDHVVPLAAGGPSIDGNIVVACKWCNETKGDMVLSRPQIRQIESLARTGCAEQAARALLAEWKARHCRMVNR